MISSNPWAHRAEIDSGVHHAGTGKRRSNAPQDCSTTVGAPEPLDNDKFGWSVDVDGDVAVIGNLAGNGTAPGAAYVVELGQLVPERERVELLLAVPMLVVGVVAGYWANRRAV